MKLLIFDLDGTLVDAFKAVTYTMNYVMDELGFPSLTHRAVKRAVGWGEGNLLTRFVGEENRTISLKLFRQHHKQALLEPGGVRFLPGVKSMLINAHKEGYILAIASNRPTVYTRLILKALGVLKLFKIIVCADRVDRAKPHPDMLKEVLRRAGIKPRDALFVGDMTVDALAGKRARIKTVCVSTGVCLTEELESEGPYKVIPRMSELKSIIQGM